MYNIHVNVSEGKKAYLSSAHDEFSDASKVLTGAPTGDISVQTQVEENPWLIVDLGSPLPISRIRVWNCDNNLQAIFNMSPVSISTSNDGNIFSCILYTTMPFGGKKIGRELFIDMAMSTKTRFIRVQLLKNGALSLDKIQIFSRFPSFLFADFENCREEDGVLKASLVMKHNEGFFSNCSTILQSILQSIYSGIYVDGINSKLSFCKFQKTPDDDIFNIVFSVKPLSGVVLNNIYFTVEDVHRLYKDFPYSIINQIIDRYFSPSPIVDASIKYFMEKYSIEPENTIAICYRGNAKGIEVDLASPEEYVQAARYVMAKNRNIRRVMVQTDDSEAQKIFMDSFGDSAFYIDALPTIKSDSLAIHDTLNPDNSIEFSINIVASVMIISKCAAIINHSGNVGAWIALFRGHCKHMYQFDARGKLSEPA